jgi:hypothetical protein
MNNPEQSTEHYFIECIVRCLPFVCIWKKIFLAVRPYMEIVNLGIVQGVNNVCGDLVARRLGD